MKKINLLVNFVFCLIILALWGKTAFAQQDEEFTFAVSGHVYPLIKEKKFGYLVENLRKLKPDIIFFTGDVIVGDGSSQEVEKQWDYFEKAMKDLSIPYYVVPGNHDIANRGDNLKRQIFEKRFGRLFGRINYRHSKFIFLNSVREIGQRDYKINNEQVDFLQGELENEKEERNIFLFIHHALWLEDSLQRIANEVYTKNNWFANVHPLIKGKVKYVFAGDGSSLFYSEKDNIRYITNGFPMNLSEKAIFLLVRVKEKDIEIQPKFLPMPEKKENLWRFIFRKIRKIFYEKIF